MVDAPGAGSSQDPPTVPESGTLVAVTFAGIAGGIAVLMLDRIFAEWSATARAFVHEQEFLVWLAVVCLEGASFAIGGLLVARLLIRFWKYGSGRWRGIGASVGVLLFLMGTFVAVSRTQGVDFSKAVIPGIPWRTGILTAFGVVVALGAAVGMWLVHAAVDHVVNKESSPPQAKLERFAELRDDMKILLAIQAAILGGAILGAGALRNAVLKGANPPDFPGEAVLVYGLFLSGLVALCFIPTQARISRLGRDLRQRSLEPMPPPDDPQWGEWYGRRKAVGEMLDLDVTALQSFRAGVAILAPLASGLLTLLLGEISG
jgi:hypothetical protein